jgi:hypothetical protein
VAMGEARTKEATRQIAMVCLDELVAEDDRYRRIDELVGDWGFVREAARPYYADALGRPSIRSDRALEADAGRRAGGDRLDA